MQPVPRTIQDSADPPNLTDLERTHVPVIEAPEVALAGEMFSVTVKVGRLPHVTKAGHHIQFIDLYADQAHVSRTMFTPTAIKPKIACFLTLDGSVTLRAIAFCNLHGSWEAERWLRVE